MNDGSDDEPTVRLPGSPKAGDLAGTGASPSPHALPIGARLAEFEVRGIIGEGGFSIVYLAWDQSLHRHVALKEYIPFDLAVRDDAQRVTARSSRHRETFAAGLSSFINEARLLASFDHHSLVKVHRFWEERGTAYMVMPWYQGPTLKEALAAAATRPDEAWLRRLLDPLTEALAVLHAQHCFHRDIAPDNILLLGPAQTPLLLDFGAARRVIGSLTHDLTAILKQGYAPIEQYGEIPGMRQGPWTDVYALAAVVHFAIRGQTPPPAVARLVDDTYRPLASPGVAGFSTRFLQAIDSALGVRAEQRTESIAAFREQLGFGGKPAATPAATTNEAVGERPGRSEIAAATATPSPAVTTAPASRRSPMARTPVAAKPPAPAARQSSMRAILFTSVALVAAASLALALREWQTRDGAATRSVSASAPASVSAAPSAPAHSSQSPSPQSPSQQSSTPQSSTPPPSEVAATASLPPGVPVAVMPTASIAAEPPSADASAAAAAKAVATDIAAERSARRSADAAIAALQRLAQAEDRDVAATVRAGRARLDQAQVESGAGRHDRAAALAREGSVQAVRSLNGLVDELVKGYGQLAEQANSAGEAEIAQQAQERAKKVAALRR